VDAEDEAGAGLEELKSLRSLQSEPKPKPIRLNVEDDNLDKTKTRWILAPHASTYLYIKFFSTSTGKFESHYPSLEFKIVGGQKPFVLPCKGICEFPMINSEQRNIFMNRRRARPHATPECFVSKTYIHAEGKYEFGSLLIGKTFDKRVE
jgi:hypothetical protein